MNAAIQTSTKQAMKHASEIKEYEQTEYIMNTRRSSACQNEASYIMYMVIYHLHNRECLLGSTKRWRYCE